MNIFSLLEKRKAEIVEAVLKLADKFGVRGITTRRIAEEVGFVEGSLYKHIKSKSDIFVMIIDAAFRLLKGKLEMLKNSELTAREKIEDLLLYMLGFLQEFPGIYRIIFSDEVYLESPDTLEKFRNFTMGTVEEVSEIIKQGIKKGEFRRDTDTETAALSFLGVIHTSFTLWNLFKNRKNSLIEEGKRLFNFFIKSIEIPKEAIQ